MVPFTKCNCIVGFVSISYLRLVKLDWPFESQRRYFDELCSPLMDLLTNFSWVLSFVAFDCQQGDFCFLEGIGHNANQHLHLCKLLLKNLTS